MYKCQLCLAVVPPGTKSRTIVLETRQVQFPPRLKAYHFNKFDWKKQKTKREVRHDPGGIGTQIVREARVCVTCAERARHPDCEMFPRRRAA